MERDFIGYGQHPPVIRWPDGARLALSIVVNYEEGAEYSLLDMGRRETMGETPSPVPLDQRDLFNESMFEYGSRAGVWRYLRILERNQIAATFFTCGLALERNPAVAKAIVAAGHEVCGHGYRWREAHLLDRHAEREEMRKAVAAIQATTGERPVGWWNRLSPSLNTRELLAEEGGFIYDSNALNDDLPYYTTVLDNPWLIVPYSIELNDARFWRGGLNSIADFEQYLCDAFDCLYAEGADTPKMMSVGLHCRIAGTPARSRAVERFIAHAREHDGVWFARRVDIARWWWEQYPPLMANGHTNDVR